MGGPNWKSGKRLDFQFVEQVYSWSANSFLKILFAAEKALQGDNL